MAKRRARTVSIDTLMAQLNELDTLRTRIVANIQAAVSSVVSGIASPSPASGAKRGRPAGSKNKTTGARKGRRKMSAAARKAIGDAQRKRWAAQKAAKK
jgi:hypothetical protein